jgi:hypothetical protein
MRGDLVQLLSRIDREEFDLPYVLKCALSFIDCHHCRYSKQCVIRHLIQRNLGERMRFIRDILSDAVVQIPIEFTKDVMQIMMDLKDDSNQCVWYEMFKKFSSHRLSEKDLDVHAIFQKPEFVRLLDEIRSNMPSF